ncbi:MAG: PEP/pyruvate-binding domain-containing protein [Gaiellaceae bacterium]
MIIELEASTLETAGGKAMGLARLRELGLPVPLAVVVPVGAPFDDADAVVARLGEPLAVRSSAVGEDATARSFAGQFETVLGVDRAGLAAAVAQVRGTPARAEAYGSAGPLAVVIQREVQATRAGVAFSRDPITGANEVFIECALGGGEAVVSGTTTPDRYWVKSEGVRARAAGSLRALRDDEAERIAQLVRAAEHGFGRPVDVEFCWEGRELWLVQCRPITTLR